MEVTLKNIEEAREHLQKAIYKTTLVHSASLSKLTDNSVYLKLENLQITGSFKIRGAFNKIAHLTEAEKKNGVIAASAGNHAQGVAKGATAYGTKSTIVMPKHAPISKIQATKYYGGNVVLHGSVYDEAYAKAREIQAETGATFIHPFDDPLVIAGQGTIGMEILEDLPDADIILVPIGGGGLISGVATAVKNINPKVKVIGVQTKNMPSMANSITYNKILSCEKKPTIADGIAVRTPGDLTFNIIKKYVDDIITVNEDEISNAILYLIERVRVIAEGAGAVPVAAIINRLHDVKNKKIVALISGGNIDVNILSRIIDRGLVNGGRKVFLETIIQDRPGKLSRLLTIISDTGANVLSVNHTRAIKDLNIGYAKVEMEIETGDFDHIKEIEKTLMKNNYIVTIS